MAITWLFQAPHAKRLVCKERSHHTARSNGPQLWRCWLSPTSWQMKDCISWHSNSRGILIISCNDKWPKSEISIDWIESLSVVSDSLWPHRLYSPRNSPDKNTEVGSISLLQGIFPTQVFSHYRRILYQLSQRDAHYVVVHSFYSYCVKSSHHKGYWILLNVFIYFYDIYMIFALIL